MMSLDRMVASSIDNEAAAERMRSSGKHGSTGAAAQQEQSSSSSHDDTRAAAEHEHSGSKRRNSTTAEAQADLSSSRSSNPRVENELEHGRGESYEIDMLVSKFLGRGTGRAAADQLVYHTFVPGRQPGDTSRRGEAAAADPPPPAGPLSGGPCGVGVGGGAGRAYPLPSFYRNAAAKQHQQHQQQQHHSAPVGSVLARPVDPRSHDQARQPDRQHEQH